MSDTKELLERAWRLAPQPEDVMDSLIRRRARKQRNRRIAAAALAIIVALVSFAALIRTFSMVERPADQPQDIFAPVHGWIVYGKSGGPLHLTSEGTWVVPGEGIWAVNPERPGHREARVQLSEQVGDPIAWSADGSALLILRAWSPDGTPLSKPGSFDKPGVSIGLVVPHADGTETRAVTIDSESGYFDGSSSLSPDGSQVVYAVTGQDDLHSASGIYVVDAEGGTPRPLRLGGTSGEVHSPAVSPDGTKIAYFDGIDLKVMNADGTNVRVLLGHNQPQVNTTPLASGLVWSPDGSHLAFDFAAVVEDRGVVGTRGISVMRADGSGLRRVIPDAGNPSWSPDGSRIAYRHAGALYVANRDGTDSRRVADLISLPFHQDSLTWNPLPLSAAGNVDSTPTVEARAAGSARGDRESRTTEGGSGAAPLIYAIAALGVVGVLVLAWRARRRSAAS